MQSNLESAIKSIPVVQCKYCQPTCKQKGRGPAIRGGGLSTPYPINFWPKYPVFHKFQESKTDRFFTQYSGKSHISYPSLHVKFVLNTPKSPHKTSIGKVTIS